MFVLIWAVLLLSVSGSTAGYDQEPSGTNKQDCHINHSCVILNVADITAEAGLCVVKPCTGEAGVGVRSISWHKCNEQSTKQTPKSDNKGRVSLLQFDLSKKNCSIIISDLTKSDSGSYNSTATDNENVCTNLSKKNTNDRGLSQKPTMVNSPLTEGQKAKLTCTAPGLWSGSSPNITWIWTGTGGNDSSMTGNITAVKTENLTVGTQRHSSTLTFISSAAHNNTKITCKVSCKGVPPTEETKTLIVRKISDTESPKCQSSTNEQCTTCKDSGQRNTNDPGLFSKVLSTAKELHGIVVFLTGFGIGVLLSTIIACLVIKCLRKKQRRSRFLPENMELVIAQSVPDLMDVGPGPDYDVIRVQGAAEGGAESSPDGDMRPKEVEYSDIDFSLMKRRNPAGAEENRDTPETEYAEIKKEAMEERPDGEFLEGNEEEKVVMMGEDEEAKQGVAAEEGGGEDMALYSNVNEVIDEA